MNWIAALYLSKLLVIVTAALFGISVGYALKGGPDVAIMASSAVSVVAACMSLHISEKEVKRLVNG